MEKQISGGEYNTTGITSHSSLSNEAGGTLSSSILLESNNPKSFLADDEICSGEGCIMDGINDDAFASPGKVSANNNDDNSKVILMYSPSFS